MSQFLIATRKGLFVFSAPTVAVCRSAFLGDPVTAVLPDSRDGALWVAVGRGRGGSKLFCSRNAGETFVEATAPRHPEERESNSARGVATEQIWSLEAGLAQEAGVLYAGTLPGGLFRTQDSADNWQLCGALWELRARWSGSGHEHPGLHSISVDPRAPKTLSIAVSRGGIWHSDDAFETFEPRTTGMFASDVPAAQKADPANQDPHRLVRCAAAPDVLWCQHHDGVYRSADAGRSWRALATIEPSSFGYAVAAHPQDPLTAWFVPLESDSRRMPVGGKVVVARTRDGGESFELLSKGLPGPDAFDVVYRHALDVSPDGKTVVMGSTTGSLFVSNDGGESWQSMHHLPPISAVRFWH